MTPDFAITAEHPAPAPKKSGGSGASSVYPFAKMCVGDSFDVPVSHHPAGNMNLLQISVTSGAKMWALRHGSDAKFTSRRVGSVLRVWRVA